MRRAGDEPVWAQRGVQSMVGNCRSPLHAWDFALWSGYFDHPPTSAARRALVVCGPKNPAFVTLRNAEVTL
jgi:hypothetical protein